mgnify:CR=1 FL=1
MEKNESRSRLSASARGAVWASLALAAGLAAAPGAALADEAPAAPGDGAVAATDQSQTIPAAASEKATADGSSQQQATADSSQEKEAPAASSDKGTYEEAGLHQVTVTYVDADGNQIAPAHREALADGESYAVQSPAVGGYELADASQATVSGTVAKGSGDVSVTVRYRSTLVSYTVIHERQVGPRSSEYRVSEAETLTAPSGTRVTAAPRSYENYTCATDAEGRTAEVTPDGRATIVIRYDVIVPSYAIYFSTNGSYVAPQTGRTGDAITRPADPTLAGYTFAGWDTDGDGRADYAAGSTDFIPAFGDKDITAAACWTPAEAVYQVRYWVAQRGTDQSKFDLVLTVTRTGITGTDAQYNKNAVDTRYINSSSTKHRYYKFMRATSAKIAGDGTTAIDVYYGFKDARVYVFTDWRAAYECLNALRKGAELSQYAKDHRVLGSTTTKVRCDQAYTIDTDELYRKYKSFAGDSALKYLDDCGDVTGYPVKDVGGFQDDGRFLPGSQFGQDPSSCDLYYILFGRYTNNAVYHYYLAPSVYQGLDGNYDSVAATRRLGDYAYFKSQATTGIGFGPTHLDAGGFEVIKYRISTNVWDGNPDDLTWGDWLDIKTAYNGSGYWLGIYRNGGWCTNRNNVAQVMLRRKSFDIAYYSNGEKLNLSSTFLFGQPLTSSMLPTPDAPAGYEFAGWYDKDGNPIDGSTMPVGGLILYARWKRPDVTVTFDAAGGTPVDAQTVAWDGKATEPVAPTREGYQFGGWYFFGSGSSTPARFSFDMPLEADAHLVAAWRSTNTPTTYTVRHVLSDGTVLWEETLPGTVGQTVSAFALGKGDARRRGHAYASASGATIDLAADAPSNVITFTYSDDASHAYVVHLWDEATGLPVAADIEFDSAEALLDYLAPEVPGYHVLFGGQGYLSARDGGQELTFWYERDPEPAEPAAPAAAESPRHMAETASVKEPAASPRHMAAVPSTGDATSPVALAAAGAIGLGLAALGALLRRRREE